MSKDYFKRVVDLLRKTASLCAADAAYSKFTTTGSDPRASSRIDGAKTSASPISKTYNMTGWRLRVCGRE